MPSWDSQTDWDAAQDRDSVVTRDIGDWTTNDIELGYDTDFGPLASNLVGFWPMAETASTTIEDVSGNGNDGTAINSPSYNQSGLVSQPTLGFDETDSSHVEATLSHPSTFSFGCWVYLAENSTDSWAAPVSARYDSTRGDSVTAEGFWIFMESGTNDVSWSIGYTDGSRTHSTLQFSNIHTIGQWDYYGISWDGTDALAYHNGSVVGTDDTHAGKTVEFGPGIRFGRDSRYGFTGRIAFPHYVSTGWGASEFDTMYDLTSGHLTTGMK